MSENASSPVTGATLRLMAGAAMISLAPVFVRVVDVSATVSAFYRTFFGGLILLAWIAVNPRRAAASKRTLAWLALAGIAFAADLWAWHQSIWDVGPGLATLLANFQVFVLGLAGVWLFGEAAGWRLWLAIPLALAGLGLIIGFEWSGLTETYRRGILYGLLTAVFYSAYILALRGSRHTRTPVSPAAGMAVASLVSAVILAAVATAGGESLAIPSGRDAGLLAAYAVIAQVLGWLLISASLKHVPASRVGLILLLQPTLAFLWDVLFFSRTFGHREMLGAAMALGAIYLGSRRP